MKEREECMIRQDLLMIIPILGFKMKMFLVSLRMEGLEEEDKKCMLKI